MSLYSFNMKLSYILSSLVISGGLALAGYASNVEASLMTQTAIKLLMTFIPGVVVVAGFLYFRAYNLSARQVERMQRELEIASAPAE